MFGRLAMMTEPSSGKRVVLMVGRGLLQTRSFIRESTLLR